MPVAGKLGDKMGPRTLSVAGVFILGAFMWMYRTLDANTSVWDVITPTYVRAFGMALLMTPVMATALNAVPKRLAGQASSLLSLTQQVSGSIGIAVLATVLTHRSLYHMNVVGSGLSAASPAFAASMGELGRRALEVGYSHADAYRVAGGMLMRQAFKAAQISGFDDAFLVGTFIVSLALIPCLFLPGSPVHHAEADPSEMVAAD